MEGAIKGSQLRWSRGRRVCTGVYGGVQLRGCKGGARACCISLRTMPRVRLVSTRPRLCVTWAGVRGVRGCTGVYRMYRDVPGCTGT